MKRFVITVCLLEIWSMLVQAQSSVQIFAHNDYVQPIPFYYAYEKQVEYIEADIFLQQGRLVVAHTAAEIDPARTLDSLYLAPLVQKVIRNQGYAYSDKTRTLTLMIDLKSEGIATVTALATLLKGYPTLLKARQLYFVVSGNVPDPATWAQIPEFINFDGRPGTTYTPDQLKRIRLISDSFTKYTTWNGKGVLPDQDLQRIKSVISAAHSAGKNIRFWAAPDFENAWIKFINLEVDVIGTDRLEELSRFMKTLPGRRYINDAPHAPYVPSCAHDRNARPKNIILMIGDGTGLPQLFSGYTANGGRFNLFGIKDVGLSMTSATDSYITDSAAGATAMATGIKTKNRFVGVDSAGRRLTPITELLKTRNFRTAIISNGDITDATPASFYAHQPERSMSEAIALDFLSTDNDILIGGNITSFEKRGDKRNLLQELKGKGYDVFTELSSLKVVRGKKFVVLDERASRRASEGRGDFLMQALKQSLASLGEGRSPFFMMLESAQIDWGGHNNDMGYVVTEVLDFDQVIGEAMRFVDQNKETLLIITADHETGGLSLLDGDLSSLSVIGSFSTNDHTPLPVPVFAYGPGSGAFTGVYENTEIFKRIIALLNR